MRLCAACLLSLALVSTALAREPGAAPGSALDELLRGMASTAGLEVRFREQKDLSLLSAPLESHGVIYFVPPDRFARFTLSPGYSSLVVDGEALRFRDGRDGDEVDLTGSPTARVFVDNFIVLWSGDRERLAHLYEVELRGDRAAWRLALEPRRRPLSRFIQKIVLSGDAAGMQRMLVQDLNGDRTTTRLEQIRSDRTFTAKELHRIFVTRNPLDGVLGER